ncbi:hypothetical protein KPL71_024273 [Citrus sinensis]|uniref:Uncharacterized protein n=2 Tax=Citrus sinensis TaxID=2711 RepID=A0ACB8IQI1_CITSI|nr:hypothetical protein KPL71_024273 [Citrus sinensis]KDO54369.1 hypothetical protein CISIN_1g041294mg [Citrus sinensis]
MWKLWFMLLILSWQAAASSSNNAKPGCQEKCGGITVPYPFGIDDPKCALNVNFSLKCNKSFSPPKLMYGNIVVLNISIEDGSMIASMWTARSCYNSSGRLNYSNVQFDLGDGRPFRFSDTRNKLTAFGCDTTATMTDRFGSFGSICGSICLGDISSLNNKHNSCHGIGCCQIGLAKSLKSLNISLDSTYNYSGMLTGETIQCDYAVLADEHFDLSELRSSDYSPDNEISSKVTVEWVVKEEKCPVVSQNSSVYACANHTDCKNSDNGEGYRCLCWI